MHSSEAIVAERLREYLCNRLTEATPVLSEDRSRLAEARGVNLVKRTTLTMLVGLFAVTAQAFNFGVYDFAETMRNRPLAVEETFVNQRTAKGWANATEERSLYELCMSFKSKGRMPLITIEPRSNDDVLKNVATGKCDAELGAIAAHLRAYGGPAIIRWGHEAENRMYPWGGKTPEKYIMAYRYVVDYFRDHLVRQKLYFCWTQLVTRIA